jgi:hypothetical protein
VTAGTSTTIVPATGWSGPGRPPGQLPVSSRHAVALAVDTSVTASPSELRNWKSSALTVVSGPDSTLTFSPTKCPRLAGRLSSAVQVRSTATLSRAIEKIVCPEASVSWCVSPRPSVVSRDGPGVGVGLDVDDGADVSLGVGVSVALGVSLGVDIGVGASVGLDVPSGVDVGVGVSVALDVPSGVDVGVGPDVAVGVLDGVCETVGAACFTAD